MLQISSLLKPIKFLPFLIVLFTMVLNGAIAAPPSFSSVFSPGKVGPGNESTLVFTITTDAQQGIRDGQFVNTFPGNLVIATPGNVNSNCTNAVINAGNGTSVLSVSGIELAASSVCSVWLRVKTGLSAFNYNIATGDFSSDAGSSGTATATLAVDDSNMPGYSLSFSPEVISQGATSTLALNFNDATAISSFGSWSATINLSDGLAVAAVPNATTDCQNTTITANAGNSSISLSGFSSPANPCSVDVDVRASGLGKQNASVNSLNWGSVGDIGQAGALLTVSSAFANFEFDPLVVAPGSTTSLNITLINRDRINALSDISFSDDLNAVLIGLLATDLPRNDICGAGSSISGSSILSFNAGSLAPEASCSFSIPVLIPGDAAPGIYSNTSSAFDMISDSVALSEDPATNALQVSAAPVLTMDFVDTIAASGGTTTINYTITNTDTADAAADISFSHNLGADFNGVSIPVLPVAGFCGAGSTATVSTVLDNLILNISGAELAAAASCNLAVDILLATGTPGGEYTTATDTVSATIDANSVVGPGASGSITIAQGPLLTLQLPLLAIAPGDQVPATFTLSKQGNTASVSGIGFNLNLENALAGLTVASLPLGEICGTGSGVTLVINAGEEITFAGGILDIDDSCSFTVDLDIPDSAESGSYSLESSAVTSTVLGVSVSGFPAEADLDVTNLVASMSFVENPVAPGETSTLRFSFQNTSTTEDLTSIVTTLNLGDVIPGMVATVLPAGGYCGAGSTISGTTSFLILSGGNLLTSTDCSFDVTVSVPGGATADTYRAITGAISFTENGNAKTLSPLLTRLTVEIDEAPTVTITSTLSPATSVTPIPVTITFIEDVTGFEVSDITGSVTNGSLSNFVAVSASVYSVDITPLADGDVTLQIPAGSAQDFASVANDNIISALFSIEFDNSAFVLPTVTIDPPDKLSTSTGPVSYAITYADADQVDLNAAKVNLVSTGTATATLSVINGTTNTPTVTLSSITGNGTLAINLVADTARNSIGSVSATANSQSFVVDQVPTVVITSALPPVTSVTPIPVTITFNEAVTGFDISDISGAVLNGTLSNFNTLSASVYTVDITPLANGAVSLFVPAGSAQDLAINPNDNFISPAYSINFNASVNDDDGDGIVDDSDTCAMTLSGMTVDANGCSSPQRLALFCPIDGEYKNHGKYVKCVVHEVHEQLILRLISTREARRLVVEAARSDVGKDNTHNNGNGNGNGQEDGNGNGNGNSHEDDNGDGHEDDNGNGNGNGHEDDNGNGHEDDNGHGQGLGIVNGVESDGENSNDNGNDDENEENNDVNGDNNDGGDRNVNANNEADTVTTGAGSFGLLTLFLFMVVALVKPSRLSTKYLYT